MSEILLFIAFSIKYFLKKSNSTIVFLSKDEFEKKLKDDLLNKSKKENEDKNGN